MWSNSTGHQSSWGGDLHSNGRLRFDMSGLALAVELVLCTLSAAMGLGIFLPSILRSQERTLRFQLIIGLSCSDFLLAMLSFFETIITMAGKHPGTGSALCNLTGFFTSTFVFVQYLWAIAMACATFLLLRHPMSATTLWLSRHWGLAWVVFYAISFGQAGAWWARSRYELSGGFCYYGAQDQRWSDSLQLVCRGLVLVIVSSLYANLFLFLRRPTLGVAGRRSSSVSGRRQSANTRYSTDNRQAANTQTGEDDSLPPWERVNFSNFTLHDDKSSPEDVASQRGSDPPSPTSTRWRFFRGGQPPMSDAEPPLRPDLVAEIPFRKPDPPDGPLPLIARSPQERTRSVEPAPSFEFGSRARTSDASSAEVVSRVDPLASTPPRRSSLARHRRAVSDATPSPPRKVSFSCVSPDVNGSPLSPPPPGSASSLFAGFSFGTPAATLAEAPSTMTLEEPTQRNVLSDTWTCPSQGTAGGRRSSLPNALLDGSPATRLGGRGRLPLPPSSLRRSSLPISALNPVVPRDVYASQDVSPAGQPPSTGRTSLVTHLVEGELARSVRPSSPDSVRTACDGSTSDPYATSAHSSCVTYSPSSATGPTKEKTTCSLAIAMDKQKSSSTGSTRIKPLALIGYTAPDLVRLSSSQTTLPVSSHPFVPGNPKVARPRPRTRPLSLGRLSSDFERSQEPNLAETPSKATYMRRKASQLMVYLPTAYLFMFIVFCARFGVELNGSGLGGGGSGKKGEWVRALSRWVRVGQGVINGAIYGIVEHRARRSIQQLEAADERRRCDEERRERDAELVALALERMRMRERSEEDDDDDDR